MPILLLSKLFACKGNVGFASAVSKLVVKHGGVFSVSSRVAPEGFPFLCTKCGKGIDFDNVPSDSTRGSISSESNLNCDSE